MVRSNAACFVVIDANGQKLAYVYFEEEPGRQPRLPGFGLFGSLALSCCCGEAYHAGHEVAEEYSKDRKGYAISV